MSGGDQVTSTRTRTVQTTLSVVTAGALCLPAAALSQTASQVTPESWIRVGDQALLHLSRRSYNPVISPDADRVGGRTGCLRNQQGATRGEKQDHRYQRL